MITSDDLCHYSYSSSSYWTISNIFLSLVELNGTCDWRVSYRFCASLNT